MKTSYRETPGAHTPWSFVNQLLADDERFEVSCLDQVSFLLAPKTTSRLVALLYCLHQHSIPFSVQGKEMKEPFPTCSVSARAFSRLMMHEQDILEVGAGCSLIDLQSFLFEKRLEVNVEESPLASSKQAVIELIVSGQTTDLQLKQENVSEALLGIEWITEKGCQLQWGGPHRSGLAGPMLHKLVEDLQCLPGFIVKMYLKAYRVPARRLHLTWPFRRLDALWEQFHQLKRFSSSWERLDCVWSGQAQSQNFILAQISGLKEEMEAFTQLCPGYSFAQLQDKRAQLKQFFHQQSLHAYLSSKQQPLEVDEYVWYHGLSEKTWWLTPRFLANTEEKTEPLWKQYLWESIKNG